MTQIDFKAVLLPLIASVPILFITGSGFILTRALKLLIEKMPAFVVPEQAHFAEVQERRRKVQTAAANLLSRIVSFVFVAVAVLRIHRRFRADNTPLITGGALAVLAVGFGAQDLVRDYINGFFVIVENQIRIGDVAALNGKEEGYADLA